MADKGRVDEARAVVAKVFGEGVKLDFRPPAGESVNAGVLFRSGYGRVLFRFIPLFGIYAFAHRILGALGLGGSMATLDQPSSPSSSCWERSCSFS